MNISYTIARSNLGEITPEDESAYSVAVGQRLCEMYPNAEVTTCVDDCGDRDVVEVDGTTGVTVDERHRAWLDIIESCREAAQAVWEDASWGVQVQAP